MKSTTDLRSLSDEEYEQATREQLARMDAAPVAVFLVGDKAVCRPCRYYSRKSPVVHVLGDDGAEVAADTLPGYTGSIIPGAQSDMPRLAEHARRWLTERAA